MGEGRGRFPNLCSAILTTPWTLAWTARHKYLKKGTFASHRLNQQNASVPSPSYAIDLGCSCTFDAIARSHIPVSVHCEM
jgi:hypothetical protein